MLAARDYHPHWLKMHRVLSCRRLSLRSSRCRESRAYVVVGVEGADGRLDSPRCPPPPPDLSQAQCDRGAPLWQEWPRACDPPSNPGTCRPNLRAASQWQASAPLEATQWGQVITAAPFKESSSQCCCLPPLDHTWHEAASQARWAFLPTLYTPLGSQRPGEGQTFVPYRTPGPQTFIKRILAVSDSVITALEPSIILWELRCTVT